MVQTFNVNKRNQVLPIEWEPYKGEEITVNTIIRKGKRIFEKEFYADKVVMNADFAQGMTTLFPDKVRKKWSNKKFVNQIFKIS